MNSTAILVILLRWIHVSAACLIVGGLFFLRVLVPLALKTIDPPDTRHAAFLRLRRVFKMVVHSAILLLLITGTINSIRAFPDYNLWPAALHGLWGLHVLGALAIFGIALWLLAGAEPPASHRRWWTICLTLMFIILLAAATLKYLRERTVAEHNILQTVTQTTP